jgi:5'-phosphate synthase pdxT subunit
MGQMASRPPLIGVLALQGAYREHVRALQACGATTRLVRLPSDLDGLSGLVLPGGESTTMTLLASRVNLLEPLRSAIASGLPTLATCAGAILLASTVLDGMQDQTGLGLLPITIRRNAYGPQKESFEAPLSIPAIGAKAFPAIFIRSPIIESAGSTQVLARHANSPVAVRQGHILALCFHPELTTDLRLHHYFLALAAA